MGLNVYGFMGFPMPAQPFGWFKGEVNTVADLQGFKYRTVGLAADLLQGWACRSPSCRAARSCPRWSAA
jgi:TRAP-type mannitol/chloroaromatic compound transport system substrate-binding protein